MSILTEETTKVRFINPALNKAGWMPKYYTCEDRITDGTIAINGEKGERINKGMRPDYCLHWPDSNHTIAIVEAKDYQKTASHGLQQAITYASMVDADFAFSTNGKEFCEHDMNSGKERSFPLDEFPSPQELWQRHLDAHKLTEEQAEQTKVPYYYEYGKNTPRYYQRVAINRTVEAAIKGNDRLLLVMATGTGKTYTAFQIVWRLREAGLAKKVLYLADRNVLLNQTRSGDFEPFNRITTKVSDRKLDSAYEIFFSTYQQLVNDDPDNENAPQPYEKLSPTFFDLVIVDECHRGSAKADSSWHRILKYFNSAIQLGMTATPKETKDTSTSNYFGEPLYTYSLKQGIEDGFLAPYRVKRINLDIDEFGFVPKSGQIDDNGNLIEAREYTQKDINRTIVFTERDKIVAREISNYLKATDRFQKTIVFCEDIEHAERMRSALVNENSDIVKEHPSYVQRCTGDVKNVTNIMDDFMDVDARFPTVLTTSKLLTTGVNCKTCKCIVLDNSFGEQGMTEFKQIIGRGTRIQESREKLYFTVLDFKNATRLFADPDFDGEPPFVYNPKPNNHTKHKPDDGGGDEPPVPPRGKYQVSGVDVTVTGEQVSYYWMGKLHTESLVDYTRNKMHDQYQTLDDFINKWNNEEKKAAICEELEKQGVFLSQLRSQTGRDDWDDFDLICHIAYDVPAMTKRERAQAVIDSGYLDQFSEAAKQVLNALLDKYASAQIRDLDDIGILQLREFQEIGSVPKIVKIFGGKDQFLKAAQALEDAIYQVKPAA